MSQDTADRDIVLLVDDAPDTVRMLAMALEQSGFTVLVATDGAGALARIAHVRPDVVLLDACMPGMDGFETCRRLRAEPDMASVPILFMTGLGETDRIVEGLDAGGNDYLVKPVLPAELTARIRAHLRVARTTSSALAALETTGLALASFDAEGHPIWATPSARKLLAQPAMDQAAAIATWLAGAGDAPLALDIGCGRLQLQALGRGSSGQMLVRLEASGDEASAEPRPALTPRETDVLEWVAKGKTNRDIGDILGMSPRTVNKHLEHIYAKLGVETRTAAVAQFDRMQQGRP
jgi:DNA-binding NarL/FixJ family response regulator